MPLDGRTVEGECAVEVKDSAEKHGLRVFVEVVVGGGFGAVVSVAAAVAACGCRRGVPVGCEVLPVVFAVRLLLLRQLRYVVVVFFLLLAATRYSPAPLVRHRLATNTRYPSHVDSSQKH